MTTTETTTAAPAVEIGELRRAVVAMREELDRRDVEQMELEGVVEYLLDEHSTHLLVLGSLVQNTLGDDARFGGDVLMGMLYRGPLHEAGFRQGQYVIYRRPARRWKQFGGHRELRKLAAQHGVKQTRDDTRESLIRRLWSHRPLHGEFPGCVGPFD